MDIDIKIVLLIGIVLFVVWNLMCDGEEKFHLAEPKFPPKDFVMLKQPCKLTEQQKRERECEIARNSQVGSLDQLTHRGPHEPRNGGYSPKYHGEKTVQYIPAWPNVTDNNAVWEEIPEDNLSNPGDYPILKAADTLNINQMIY
jgi:hypothetical protein